MYVMHRTSRDIYVLRARHVCTGKLSLVVVGRRDTTAILASTSTVFLFGLKLIRCTTQSVAYLPATWIGFECVSLLGSVLPSAFHSHHERRSAQRLQGSGGILMKVLISIPYSWFLASMSWPAAENDSPQLFFVPRNCCQGFFARINCFCFGRVQQQTEFPPHRNF